MRRAAPLAVVVVAFLAPPLGTPSNVPFVGFAATPPAPPAAPAADLPSEESIRLRAMTRMDRDLEALARFRPSYPFWSHVFTIPDGSVAFGSASDGRLLAVFPAGGDWSRNGRWEDSSLSYVLRDQPLPRRLGERRDRVASLLASANAPVVHNPTRGDFVRPNAALYGGFLAEWGVIYERFGVPAELGLAQAVVESGFQGKIRSSAGAIGFCQWLSRNWNRLDRLTPYPIEAPNQTTQAPFCAAYLSVLATKYGSFIPALSEHHAGLANVGRTVINGGRLGAEDVRERYFIGAELARDLRAMSFRTYRDVVGTYGPRSFLYSEMVFGNMDNVRSFRGDAVQQRISAMRAPRAIGIEEVVRRTGLSVEEVRRYNPALVRRVPKGATLYLPDHVADFGEDVAFWHQPTPPEFAAVLDEFIHMDEPLERWEDPSFDDVLQEYRRRFRATGTEEGVVMDAVLGYVIQEMPLGRKVLSRYRNDPEVERLLERGVRMRQTQEQEPLR